MTTFYGKTGRLTRYSHNGTVKSNIQSGITFVGLSMDSNGKIWAIDESDDYIHRIDPEINGIDLSKRIVYGTHAVYGSMTSQSSNNYDRGTWTVIHDSNLDNAYWSVFSWNSYEPKGTKVSVHVRSSNDKNNWSNWKNVINGVNLKLTPNGRYLEVETTLERNGTSSPAIYDLSVKNIDSNLSAADLGVLSLVIKAV